MPQLSGLSALLTKMVHLLPSGHLQMSARRKKKERSWTPGPDYRLICPCQFHARQAARGWRRTLRIASRGAAVLVSVPLALALFDLPSEAMNLNITALRSSAIPSSSPAPPQKSVEFYGPQPLAEAQQDALQIFTTPAIREQFLRVPEQETVALEVFKEQYFRKHVPFGAIIYREARRNKLPPELVAAIVHTESDFRPHLVSHKSAQGLMQIIPSTARLLGIENPFDPEENIAAGTKYYRYLLNRFDDQTIALAAYNAGEGNVQRFGGIPPFKETRSYVAKVNRRTHRYRQRVHNGYLSTLRTPAALE